MLCDLVVAVFEDGSRNKQHGLLVRKDGEEDVEILMTHTTEVIGEHHVLPEGCRYQGEAAARDHGSAIVQACEGQRGLMQEGREHSHDAGPPQPAQPKHVKSQEGNRA